MEDMLAIIKKQPGLLFIKGVSDGGEKEGEARAVWRIMEARRVLEVL